MRKGIYGIIALAAMMAVFACGGRKGEAPLEDKTALQTMLKGDSTIYGLVCDGCTDSVLVFLPSDDSDPVKYDIIDATQGHKVFGHLKVGDWVAIMVDPEDSTVADLVVDLDQLKGTWCYQVMPQLRDIASMSKRMQKRMLREMPDSMKQALLAPREYGFTLKHQFSAMPVGFRGMRGSALDEESPVVYPEVPRYEEWHIWNGRLILSRDTRSLGDTTAIKGRSTMAHDTATLVMMTQDTLVLKFADRAQGYYRQRNAAK